jgi:uncharacterized protein
MKIDVQCVGEEPDELHIKLEPEWFVRELEGVHHTDGEGQGEARLLVSKAGGKLQVTGQLTARFPVSCGRCLEAAQISVDEPFVMFFEESSDNPQAPADDLELTAEDLHWATYTGPEVDLAPFLRGQLLLAVPMTPLCRPDCEGLLEHVQRPDPLDDEGVEQVELDGKAIDPRWNALAKLKPTR